MTDQQMLPTDRAAKSNEQPDELWRKEVHARVAGYRNRRARRAEPAVSLQFPFPPVEVEAQRPPVQSGPAIAVEQTQVTAATEQAVEATVAVEELPEASVAVFEPLAEEGVYYEPEYGVEEVVEEVEPTVAAPRWEDFDLDPDPIPPPPRARLKVIAFPRQASTQDEILPRLADPIVSAAPRILDVPEELEAYTGTPLLDGLQCGPSPQSSGAAPADHIDLPFQAIRISRRLYSGIVDCGLVAVASGIFGGVCYLMLPKTQLSKPMILIAAALPILFWAIYQYIFMLYRGATVGMTTAKIRLATFKGGSPSWHQRRSRVFGLYFSSSSLAMGLLWALVDVDGLCWHDRISRTYLTGWE